MYTLKIHKKILVRESHEWGLMGHHGVDKTLSFERKILLATHENKCLKTLF